MKIIYKILIVIIIESGVNITLSHAEEAWYLEHYSTGYGKINQPKVFLSWFIY